MREDFKDVYKLFVETWGKDTQADMCIEEMSELTKELCKNRRIEKGFIVDAEKKKQENLEHVREEIADVLNMVEQMEYIFGVDEIEKIRKQKMKRTKAFIIKE